LALVHVSNSHRRADPQGRAGAYVLQRGDLRPWAARYDRHRVDVVSVTAELLAQPLDQFTSRRNATVKELKASGQAALARELSGLKKPSLPLWAVNQVHDRAMLGGLRSAAQAVVKAQAAAATGRSNAARDLRAASEDFQRKLEAAGNATATVLQSRHAAGEETLRRIREIFRLAALQGGDTWERLQAGALTIEPRPGDDLVEMFGAGGAPVAGRQAEQAEARRAAELAQRAARADEELAERATAAAHRRRQEAKEAAVAAKRAAERAAAAEKEAARTRAQAQKSQRAARAQDPAKKG